MPEEQAPAVDVSSPVEQAAAVTPAPKSHTTVIVALIGVVIALLVVLIVVLHKPAVVTSSDGPLTVKTAEALTPAMATNENSYKIVYTSENSIYSMLGTSVKSYIGEFRKGKNTKVVTEMFLAGQKVTSTSYNIDGTKVTCADGIYTDGPACQLQSESDLSYLGSYGEESINSLVAIPKDAQSLGVQTIAGRECNQVSFTFTNSSLGATSGMSMFFLLASALKEQSGESSDEDAQTLFADACIDKDTKLLLALNISMMQHSELTGEETHVPIVSYTAVNFTTSVSESEFFPPVSVISSVAGCNDKTVVVLLTALRPGDYPVQVTAFTKSRFDEGKQVTLNQSLGIKKFTQSQNAQVSFTPPKADPNAYGALTFNLCVGGDCNDLSCYASSYGVQNDCFTSAADKTACEAKQGCVYTDPKCEAFSCYVLKDKDTCNQHNECGWQTYGSIGSCGQKICTDYTNQTSCELGKDCAWTNNVCANKPYNYAPAYAPYQPTTYAPVQPVKEELDPAILDKPLLCGEKQRNTVPEEPWISNPKVCGPDTNIPLQLNGSQIQLNSIYAIQYTFKTSGAENKTLEITSVCNGALQFSTLTEFGQWKPVDYYSNCDDSFVLGRKTFTVSVAPMNGTVKLLIAPSLGNTKATIESVKLLN